MTKVILRANPPAGGEVEKFYINIVLDVPRAYGACSNNSREVNH